MSKTELAQLAVLLGLLVSRYRQAIKDNEVRVEYMGASLYRVV